MQIETIQNRIYEIREYKVMLDFDLAELYEVETRVLNQAIKRNIDSFPEDFMFRLTTSDWQAISSSQIVMMGDIPKNRTGKYLPYAFTEHGVTMLASVLKSTKARQINIAIVRAFIALRKFAVGYKGISGQLWELKQELGKRIDEHDIQLRNIYDALENLLDKEADKEAVKTEWKERERIGFKR